MLPLATSTVNSCYPRAPQDVYVRYESYASQWTSVDYPVGTRCDCPSDSACSMMLHGQPAPATGSPETLLKTLVDQATAREFSYIFVTNRTMPNPWDGLPSYFDALMRVVAPESSAQSPPPLPSPHRPLSSPSPVTSPRPSPLVRPSPPSPLPPPAKLSPRPPYPQPRRPPPPPPRPPSPRPPPPPSPRPSPAPPPPRPSPPSPSARSPPLNKSLWRPAGKLNWQWQLSGDDFRPMLRTKPQVGPRGVGSSKR